MNDRKRNWMWGLAIVCVGAVGCTGTQAADEADFAPLIDLAVDLANTRDAGSAPLPSLGQMELEAQPGDVLDEQLLKVGSRCRLNKQCDSGACVDGYCCSSECGDLCATCGAPESPGTCVPDSFDPICPVPFCSADTECLHWESRRINCAALGQCGQAECLAVPQASGTVCGDGGEGRCDGQGACVVPDRASLGDSCATNNDCAEGHCVESAGGQRVCCSSACDGVCEQCSVRGRCEETPAADTRCGQVSCPADSVCRDYPSSLPAGQCRGFGVCAQFDDCLTSYSLLRPRSACACGEDGSCDLARGEACRNASDCAAGDACEETAVGTRVCSSNSCAAQGLLANRTGTDCVQCEGIGVQCLGNVEQRCFGGVLVPTSCINGCDEGVGCSTRAGIGAECSVSECQQGAVCQTDLTGTRRCCARDCSSEGAACNSQGRCECPRGQTFDGQRCGVATGNRCSALESCADGTCQEDGDGALRCCPADCGDRVCAPDGSCQCPQGETFDGARCVRAVAAACERDSDCRSGFCTDGVCCQEACDGACEQCSARTGLCQPLGEGRSDSLCLSPQQCGDGRGECRLPLGAQCELNEQCAGSNCELNEVGALKLCCVRSCSGEQPYCADDGRRCVSCTRDAHCPNGCNEVTGQCLPQLRPGQECSSSAQCAGEISSCQRGRSGERVCCEFDCAAAGKVCTSGGRCECPSGQVSSGAGGCAAARDTTPPRVRSRAVTIAVTGVNQIQLSFSEATDEGSAPGSLQYAVVQSESSFGNTASVGQVLSATSRRGVHYARRFSSSVPLGLMALQHKAFTLYFVVLVRDVEGNMSRYNEVSARFGSVQAQGECRSDADCVLGCHEYYLDEDADCFARSRDSVRLCLPESPVSRTCGGREVRSHRGRRYLAEPTREDCDDSNNRVFPGQDESSAVPTDSGSYDYDCSGSFERISPENVISEADIRRLAPGGLCTDCGRNLGYAEEGRRCGEPAMRVFCPRGIFSITDGLTCPLLRESGPLVSCR